MPNTWDAGHRNLANLINFYISSAFHNSTQICGFNHAELQTTIVQRNNRISHCKKSLGTMAFSVLFYYTLKLTGMNCNSKHFCLHVICGNYSDEPLITIHLLKKHHKISRICICVHVKPQFTLSKCLTKVATQNIQFPNTE